MAQLRSTCEKEEDSELFLSLSSSLFRSLRSLVSDGDFVP